MAAVWTLSGDTLDPARMNPISLGVQTACLITGGRFSFGGASIDDVEEYNGSVWSLESDMPEDRAFHGAFGTSLAAAVVGGHTGSVYLKTTKEYNGTTWASGGDIPIAKSIHMAVGSLSAGLTAGGFNGAVNDKFTFEYDGTSWATSGDLTDVMSAPGFCGSQSAALVYVDVYAQEYNGSVWATAPILPAPRQYLAGCGTAGDAVAFGGHWGGFVKADTYEFNGDAWSTKGDMVVGRVELTGCGASTSGLSAGGRNSAFTVMGTTEEYNSVTIGRHRGISGIDGGILFDGKTIIGDRSNGQIYALDMNTYTSHGEAIIRVRRTQIINKRRVNILHQQLEIEFEPGVGADVAEGSDGEDPQADLKWSDDGGNNWTEGRSVDIGEHQQYGTRAIWRQLGKSRNRIYELTITDPVKVVIIGADARLKACKV